LEYVDPIKDIRKITAIKRILKKQSLRDLLLFVFGINTGLRVSELLSLRVGDIWEDGKFKEFLYIKDAKTSEERAFYLNQNVREAAKHYLETFDFSTDDYLFKSKKNQQPISRQQAYRIINCAAKEVGIPGKIGTHTLRKTFGYHAYRKGIAISILMNIYHHHSPGETLRYLGIDKNEKLPVKVDVNL
jgi:site-specific recombinase XerD